MINEECKKQVKAFLLEYPNPSVLTVTTMKCGYVSCIKPVPTIFGATLMCHGIDIDELNGLIK